MVYLTESFLHRQALSKGSELEGVGRVSLRWAPATTQASSNSSDPTTRTEESIAEDAVMAEPTKEVVDSRAPSERGELGEGVEEDNERSWNR